MAYNPIAPTSSRENRKRPTNAPQGAIIVVDDDGDLAYATGSTDEADGFLAVDGGDFVILDESDGTARGIALGADVIALETT